MVSEVKAKKDKKEVNQKVLSKKRNSMADSETIRNAVAESAIEEVKP